MSTVRNWTKILSGVGAGVGDADEPGIGVGDDRTFSAEIGMVICMELFVPPKAFWAGKN